MTKTHIQHTMASLVTDLAEHPEKCLAADTPATATIEAGLRCHATGPRGAALTTDMPVGIGGGGSGPSPGWYLRAALATCDATVIAMRAAQLGVVLTTLEVTVESESDSRGLLGMDGGITPGPLSIRTRVHIAADGVPSEQLRALVTWAEERSPVADALRRAVPVTTSVEIHDYPDLW
jgi:uncharacterized OsmC-like protein